MFQITILFLYIIAAASLAASRLTRFSLNATILPALALTAAFAGFVWHGLELRVLILTPDGIAFSIGNAASFIGLQLALTALIISFEASLRGLAAGLLILAALAAAVTGHPPTSPGGTVMTWQLETHVLISLFAYGLLTIGAIVAGFALVQDQRLHAGRLSPVNQLFAPLETNEKLLYGIATVGFIALLLAVFSGFLFVDDLFAQHLIHKTFLSMLALLLFGILLAGRWLAGWRGRRAVYLYLWGFGILGLAYFGSRYILEQVLGRSWG